MRAAATANGSSGIRNREPRGGASDSRLPEISVAREVHEREDLLRDATAFVPRIDLRVGGADPQAADFEVFAGFRGEALSLYFAGDPVYHFNSRRQLRRAFVAGRLVKAEHGRLAAMVRRRSLDEAVLERTDLNSADQDELLDEMRDRLTALQESLAANHFTIVGEAPAGGRAIDRLRGWLERGAAGEVAASPGVQ